MNLDKLISGLSPEISEAPWFKGIIALVQTLEEKLQRTDELLVKSEERIKLLEKELSKFRKTPKRPLFHPNKMVPRERKSGPSSSGPTGPASIARQAIKEVSEVKVTVDHPKGSRFKGYRSFCVQEICLIAKEITYKLETWQAPSGKLFQAELPNEQKGSHYGPRLRALVANLYAQGLTEPTIHEFLQGVGVELSAAQVNHLLLNEAEKYAVESEAVLAAGLKEAPYIRTDDTGEKHEHKNGYCTHIGGDYFAYYKTTQKRENPFKESL